MSVRLQYILIAGVAGLLFLPFLGHVHLFDWDEINFAECAREMIVSKDYMRMQIDYMPFYEKPPLFIWMQVLSMKTLGISDYAARLPDALTGIATLLSLYYVGKRVADRQTGLWWTILYAATWLPQLYFKSGIIDPVFNYFIFLAFFQVYLFRQGNRPILHAILAGLFLGLAVMTKGPVAIVVAGIALVVYLVLNRGFRGFQWWHFLVLAFVCLFVTSIWFGLEVYLHGWTFLREFISYQAGLFSQNIADHEEPWYYHPIVLLLGCFPISLLFFQSGKPFSAVPPASLDFRRWMQILFWVVLILFSIVKTKIVHYSSLCYYPLSFLAAWQVVRLIRQEYPIKRWVQICLLILGSILALLLIAFPIAGMNISRIVPYVQDRFAQGNMEAAVSWHWWECLIGLVYLAGIWIFVIGMRRSFRRSMIGLCVLQILVIQVTLLHFTPKIEAYSQRAAVDYFEGFANKDVYLQTLGYKSYAYLFYSRKTPSTNSNYYLTTKSQVGASAVTVSNEHWLLYGVLDKPAYFIGKVGDEDEWRVKPGIIETGRKNGFVFYKRIHPDIEVLDTLKSKPGSGF